MYGIEGDQSGGHGTYSKDLFRRLGREVRRHADSTSMQVAELLGSDKYGVMSVPMLQQPAVGWVLDHMWTGELAVGVRVYDFSMKNKGRTTFSGCRQLRLPMDI